MVNLCGIGQYLQQFYPKHIYQVIAAGNLVYANLFQPKIVVVKIPFQPSFARITLSKQLCMLPQIVRYVRVTHP